MARMSATANRRAFQPPSSTLANPLVNGGGQPGISKADFASLLQESLGTDDNGNSNIGKESAVNLKLLSAVVHIGIEPHISLRQDDPFKPRSDQSRNSTELQQSLDVVLLAINQSPKIIYQGVSVNGSSEQAQQQVYVWLLSVVLTLFVGDVVSDALDRCGKVLQACLDADEICSYGGCGAVLDLLKDVSSVLARQADGQPVPHSLQNEQDAAEYNEWTSVISPQCQQVLRQLPPEHDKRIQAAIFILEQLVARSLPQPIKLQIKKQLKWLESAAKKLRDPPILYQDTIEGLRSKFRTFTVAPGQASLPDVLNENEEFPDTDRARKRRRLTDPDTLFRGNGDSETVIARTLTMKLTGNAIPDFDGLGDISSSYFRRLNSTQQHEALQLLGHSACHLAGASVVLGCELCDKEPSADVICERRLEVAKLLVAIEALQPNIERASVTPLVVLEAYRRILNHVPWESCASLTKSIAGKYTLQMLRSANRDVRLGAARLLQSFVRGSGNNCVSVVRDNRMAVREHLQTLGISGRLVPQEAVILALRNIAEVVDDEGLGITLLRLIEYLGHPNSYLSGLAASELVYLSRSLQTNMQMLLRPFWRTIGVVVARNLTSRPIIAQQLCDLLGMEVNGLLQIIEESAIPYLVVHGQTDLIHRIASSSNTPMTAFDVCVKKNNLPKILAALLAQGYSDAEEEIIRVLMVISTDFGKHDLSEWLSINHSQIACELLKALKDSGTSKESKVFQGLQLLAQLAYRKPAGGFGQRRSDAIASFMESNAWEIVTEFTREFDDSVTRGIHIERRRCLFGLGQVARLGRNRVQPVIAQICACLRSALSDPELCDTAFQAWTVVVTSLGEDEVANLLDQTFAILLSHWSSLSAETHVVAEKALRNLFKKQQAAIRQHADLLPSLNKIPELAEIDIQLDSWREPKDELGFIQNYTARISHETLVVAQLALTELVPVLREKSEFTQRSLSREQPDPAIADLIRAIMDCAVKHADNEQIVLNAAQCLGSIGKVDSSRVDSVREKRSFIVLSNFAIVSETVAFLMLFMDHVVVKEYISASSLRSKTFLGWALQELLRICQITPEITSRTRVGNLSGKDRQWFEMSEETRLVLIPFITSMFIAPRGTVTESCPHPVFKPGINFEKWLTQFTMDLLSKGLGQNVDVVFATCWKMVHFSPGTAIASFIMPYAALNLLLNGTETEKRHLQQEILCILQQPYDLASASMQESLRQCSQAMFEMVDYLSKWLQDKRKWFSNTQIRAERGLRDPAIDTALPQIEAVETLLKSIPPETITQRSIECRAYSRALLHWDEYIHVTKEPSDEDYRRLQDIYAQIDDPDGIEGISSCMTVVNAEAQILEHRMAGRWQEVQNWYEMQLTEQPNDVDVQVQLLHALGESGQCDALLHQFDGILADGREPDQKLLRFATEAAWSTAQFDQLAKLVTLDNGDDFTRHLGSHLLSLRTKPSSEHQLDLDGLYLISAGGLSYNSTTSISASGEYLLKMHVVEDLRLMTNASIDTKSKVLEMLGQRLDVLGTDVAAKNHVLNVQRAIMHLQPNVFVRADIASSWLKTAKLARKARAYPRALDAVLRAEALGDESVIIEQAKLMWLDGRHRKAIKTLESAIDSGVFNSHAYLADKHSILSRSETQEQNNMVAKAYVLLGKWLDQAGQTQSEVIIKTFRKSTEQNRLWESGWYHLGRHYNRILESEKAKPPGKESQPFLIGEATKTVIDNFLRALACGNKYLFQTLPKMLTLWLELVSNPDIEQDARRGNNKFHEHLGTQRKKVITETNAYVKRYVERLQPVALYTILPQLVARICHANQQVYEILQGMIAKVVQTFPQQSLWTLMAVTKSIDKTRAQRGLAVISKVVELQKKKNSSLSPTELRQMISAAQRFTDELLRVADYPIEGKVTKVSLARELGFNHKIAPSRLVVPVEMCLVPNIPVSNDSTTMKTFRAFSKDPVTITAFLDEALILASLQKPRKMSIRGSDGHLYAILAKPKDDLRKDQRLIEFDTMINRFLKRDIEASKRRLYIRTYAVVPLNEECGVIEWVNSLKTLRDVLLKLYRERNVIIDYGQLRQTLDDICARSADKATDFTGRVLSLFPSVLRYWFVETFPDPDAWLNARIRYTRSAAVMSMVGHILGLGDRHGENILFEEDNGGIMHVDFNCLFDKGLTFEKPEMVPFRLTHNMVDAFGVFGVEGPFRKCCEITMQLLRNHEDGLMTILETFLHDPTTDFMTAGKRRKARDRDTESLVPDTAEKMLEGVKGKVRGMLAGESVPLSVGGYVEEMIRQASNRANLARMYIGWCAFL